MYKTKRNKTVLNVLILKTVCLIFCLGENVSILLFILIGCYLTINVYYFLIWQVENIWFVQYKTNLWIINSTVNYYPVFTLHCLKISVYIFGLFSKLKHIAKTVPFERLVYIIYFLKQKTVFLSNYNFFPYKFCRQVCVFSTSIKLFQIAKFPYKNLRGGRYLYVIFTRQNFL